MTASPLLSLALGDSVQLFHFDGEPFASFDLDGRLVTVRVRSAAFREQLSRLHWRTSETAAPAAALDQVSQHVAAVALFDRPELPVAVRVGHHGGATYLDLADESGNVVRIDGERWAVITSSQSPVRFLRPKGTRPLPMPTRSGSIDLLRPIVNLGDDDYWSLARAWTIGTLSKGPYPLLVIGGSQDSGKSSTSRLLRSVVDPRDAGLRRLPRDEGDLFIAAKSGHILAFDNTSGVSPVLADALCCLSYGEGFAKRSLYTDGDEAIFAGARPVLLNGIDDAATRPDLRDRSIVLALAPVDERQRRTEAELDAEFRRLHPAILGGTLDLVVAALAGTERVRLDRTPRMADFARFAVAADEAVPSLSGRFIDAYRANRRDASREAIESSSVAVAVLELLDFNPAGWSGTATELLRALNDRSAAAPADPNWPRNPKGLANALRRIAPALHAEGITVLMPEGPRGRGHRREWTIRRTPAAQDAHRAQHGSDESPYESAARDWANSAPTCAVRQSVAH